MKLWASGVISSRIQCFCLIVATDVSTPVNLPRLILPMPARFVQTENKFDFKVNEDCMKQVFSKMFLG